MDLALEIKDLTVSFRKGRNVVTALDKINLALPGGHILGFIGPNGAAKRHLFNRICGVFTPTRGRAYIYGHRPRRHICFAYLPQRS